MTGMMDMKKRHLQLIRLLNKGQRYTAEALARETDVSLRTIQRDIVTLESLGYPIWSVSGVGGGYEMLPNRLLPPLHLREQEAIAFYLTLKWMERIPDMPFGDVRDSLAEWYRHDFPADLEARLTRLEQTILWLDTRTVPDSPFTKIVYAALDRKLALEVTYDTAKGLRTFTIEPVGMALLQARWYVYGFSTDTLRQYRIDRIHAARLLDQPVERDTLKTLLHTSDARPGPLVRLRLTPFGKRLLEDVVPNEATGAGWPVPEEEFPYLARQLLLAGSDVEVLEPLSLRELMRDHAVRLNDLYRQ